MEEEEIEEEVMAVQSVYSEGQCQVLNRRPPLLHVSLKPRTADDISQQFVEAVLVIKASMQYPAEPPQLELKDTKGLDEGRCLHLLNELRLLAEELASCPMLVFLCEAATDKLTSLNQPEGNCCFCMFPLVMDNDAESGSRPFMKLLSCFHCFHSDCFGRWWRWLQREQDISHPSTTSITSLEEEHVEEPGSSTLSEEAVLENLVNKLKAKCPVCRIPILATDISHVLRFLTADTTGEQSDNLDKQEIAKLLSTEEEIARRRYFAEKITSQEARGGIIEPKKLEVILPGMYVSSAANSASLMSGAGGSHHSSVENLNDYPNSVEDNEEHSSASHHTDIPSEAQIIDCELDASARERLHLQNASSSLCVDVMNNALNTDQGETVRVHLKARARNTNDHVPKEGRHYRQNMHANTGKQKAIWIKREKKG